MTENSKVNKKSLIDEVLWHEATSCSDDEPYLADVLVKLKLIEPLWEDYTTESDTMCWLEREPPPFLRKILQVQSLTRQKPQSH